MRNKLFIHIFNNLTNTFSLALVIFLSPADILRAEMTQSFETLHLIYIQNMKMKAEERCFKKSQIVADQQHWQKRKLQWFCLDLPLQGILLSANTAEGWGRGGWWGDSYIF